MSTSHKTFYPHQISQTTGGKYQPFKDLNNIKTDGNTYAVSTNDITKKGGSKDTPSEITCSNFKVKLPTGSDITKITVQLRYKKTAKTAGKYPSLPAPYITLLNSNGIQKKCSAPTDKLVTVSKNFNGQLRSPTTNTQPTASAANGGLTASFWANTTSKLSTKTKSDPNIVDFYTNKVQDTKFGVKISFPGNTNEYEGKLQIQFVRIIVYYKKPEYSISMKKLTKNITQGNNLELSITVNNLNRTKMNPTLMIQLPLNVSYVNCTGKNSVVTVGSEIRLNWNPKLNKDVSSRTIKLIVSCDNVSSNNNIVVSEPVTTVTKYYTFKILPASSTIDTTIETEPETGVTVNANEPDDSDVLLETIYAKQGEWSDLNLVDFSSIDFTGHTRLYFNVAAINEYGGVVITTQFQLSIKYGNNTASAVANSGLHEINALTSQLVNELFQFQLKSQVLGRHLMRIKYSFDRNNYITLKNFYFHVIPGNLTIPCMSVLKLSQEELDRLGDGFNYTVQSFFKIISSEEFVRDWVKNFRIGVFNNQISDNISITTITNEDDELVDVVTDSTDYDSLGIQEIFDNAEYWSDIISQFNTFENMTVEFTFNENYPVYILFCGDFIEGHPDLNQAVFTEPCIVESPYYNGYEDPGVYPVPIKKLISDDGESSNLQVNRLSESTGVIVYNLPVGDGYGTTDDMVIRGIELSSEIEYTDDLIVTANLRLKNDDKEEVLGTRSFRINQDNLRTEDINEMTTELTVGGEYDTWGINKGDLVDLEDLEIELVFKNVFDNETATVTLHNTQITLYSQLITHQEMQIWVEGQNIEWYNGFIQDAEIPLGLQTNVKYLNNEGTDLNEPHVQTVKEKDITLEIDVDGCDLTDSMTQARELVKLFTNQRDELNDPIPKRIEFSHIPGYFAEYIIEDDTDNAIEFADNHLKIKLTVPKGVLLKTEETVTGNRGAVTGLTKVQPYITVIPTAANISLSEEFSDQEWIGEHEDWIGKTVEIDCENRRVWLRENSDDDNPIRISQSADWNNDWFLLQPGEYQFNEINCIIQDIAFRERG